MLLKSFYFWIISNMKKEDGLIAIESCVMEKFIILQFRFTILLLIDL